MTTRELLERLNFDTLFAMSEPKRVLRSKTVRGPALGIESYADSMYYFFNFKAFPSTEGRRHKGYIKFHKPEDPDTPLEQVECEVDCDCKDYRYTWAWANTQYDSSSVGRDSLNQCWDQAPRIKNPQARPGLCKHLLALRGFLYGQDSQFPPSDDPESPDGGKRQDLVNKSKERYDMAWLAKQTNGAAIDVDSEQQLGVVIEYDEHGYPVAYRTPDGQIVRPGDEPSNQPGGPTPGSAADAAMSRELELRRRQQIRTQGGDPDAPETAGEPPVGEEPPTGVPPLPDETGSSNPPNPTNPTNEPNPSNQSGPQPPRRASNRRPPRRPESVDINMDDKTMQLVKEMVDAAQADVAKLPPSAPPAAATPPQGEKSPSQQALDYLQQMTALMSELVSLQQSPEPPADAAEPDPEATPTEPAAEPAPPAPVSPGPKPPAPRPSAGPRPHRPTPQL